jgi:peroxiredoxin
MSDRAPAPGEPAPEYRGTDALGETVEIESFRPKPVLLEFHRGTW